MKNRSLTAFAFAILFSIHAVATMPIEFIKDLDLTTEGYEDLNALHGIPWNEGILENHGELLPQGHPLRRLIQYLFHRTGTFDPSTSPKEKSVVPHLTPYAIGKFNGALKAGTEPEIDIPSGKDFSTARGMRNSVIKLATTLRDQNDNRVYRVFLALLWAKAQSKADFADYYRGVRASVSKGVKLIPKGWLTEKFEKTPAERPLLKHYDEFLFWAQTHASQAPPLERQDWSDSNVGRFADCGETSLRNFLKLILDHDGRYNIAILDTLGAPENVKAFFREYSDRESQKSVKARNDWSNLTTGHEGVNYINNGNHELDAGASNMFALLKALLPNLKAKDWNALAIEIEAARKQHGLSTLEFEKVNLKDDFGEIQFRIKNLGDFKWFFQPQHFYIAPLRSRLGKYPVPHVLTEIAVFYPPEELEGMQDWYLYATLRENENIEEAFRKLKDSMTIDIKIGLFNRLTTADAQRRIFERNVDAQDLQQIVERKDFRGSYEYLASLLPVKVNEAKILIQHPWYKEEVDQYFFPGRANMAVFSPPNGEQVLTVSGANAQIWDSKTGNKLAVLEGHTDTILSVSFSPTGEQILTAGEEGDSTARIWNSKTGEELKILKGHTHGITHAYFSPKGEEIFTQSFMDGTARTWDSKTGEELKVFKKPDSMLPAALTTPFGEQFLAVKDEIPRIWDTKTGRELAILEGYNERRSYLRPAKIYSAVLSPDGHQILTVDLDKTVRIWDSKTGKELKVLKSFNESFPWIAFSPTGEQVLVTTRYTAEIWDSKTGKLQRTLKGHTGEVTSAVFSPDGKQVLTASWDLTARIWKLDTK